MKKIIFILLSIVNILSFSAAYEVVVDKNVKFSKKELGNNNSQIEKTIKNEFSQDKMMREFLQKEPEGYQAYYVSKWDIITKNVQVVIKGIRYLSNKRAFSIITVISPDPDNFSATKLDEEAAKRYRKKTGKSLESFKNKKLSEEETKKLIIDFNKAMAEVVDEKLAATTKYSYIDYTVEMAKKGSNWEIIDMKQLNK